MLGGARLLLPELLPNVVQKRLERDECSADLALAVWSLEVVF